jgi:hypothetical protein
MSVRIWRSSDASCGSGVFYDVSARNIVDAISAGYRWTCLGEKRVDLVDDGVDRDSGVLPFRRHLKNHSLQSCDGSQRDLKRNQKSVV